MKTGRGYTVVELIVVVLFLGVFAAVCIPRLNFAVITKQKADTIARKIVTDLRRVRRLALSDAANNSRGFKLRMTGSEPYSGYEIVNTDSGVVVDNHSIASGINCNGGGEFGFGPLGNLQSGAGGLVVSGAGRSFTITIIPATGMVKCEEN